MPDNRVLVGWDGKVFHPIGNDARRRAKTLLTTGDRYVATFNLQRSERSHHHYFAALEELFNNLPEGIANEFFKREHFRKRGLIETGWRNEEQYLMGSERDAMTMASVSTQSERLRRHRHLRNRRHSVDGKEPRREVNGTGRLPKVQGRRFEMGR